MRKSHTTIMRHQEDKQSRATGSLFLIEMIAKLEWRQRNTHQTIEQLQNPTVGVTVTINTGVIPISLFLLATGTVLRKAAIDRGVRLATSRYGCRQINKLSNSTVSVLI